MQNQDIRKEIYGAGLRFWQVAGALGISDGNFSRKLRYELPEEQKQHIREIISKLTEEVRR